MARPETPHQKVRNMPRLLGLFLTGIFLLPFQFATAQDTIDLDTPEKRISYAIGQNIGGQIKADFGEGEFDFETFSRALSDVMQGDGGQLSDDELNTIFTEFQAARQAKAQAAAEEAAQETIAEGTAFLAEQVTKEGVQATDSGLLYQVTTQGDGAKPTAADTVTVHYTGRLLDGTVFDSSVARGEPATFPVSGVIPGWTEALQLMQVGSTWEVWIPQELGYGARGAGGDIPPYAVLNFTIELLGIQGQ